MDTIKEILKEAKITKSYKGYNYMLSSIHLVLENEERLCHVRRDVYQKVADEFEVDIRKVEKDIRTVRDVFWRENGKAYLLSITGVQYDEKPYPRELIEIFAEYANQLQKRYKMGKERS